MWPSPTGNPTRTGDHPGHDHELRLSARPHRLREDGRLLDRRPRRRALGHRLPQRRLLPARPAGARGRRPALRVQRADHVLVPQGPEPPPARHRPPGVPPRVRRRALRQRRPPLPRSARARRERPHRRLVPRGLRRPGPQGLGHRVRDPRGPGRVQPRVPPQAGQGRRADGRIGAAGPAGVAHLRPRRGPVRRGPDRRHHPAGDVAGVRERDRSLHAAAPRRPAEPDVRDRGGGRYGQAPPALDARLRDDHDARHPRRPEGAAQLVRGPRGGHEGTRRAADRARGRRAGRRLRPHDPRAATSWAPATTASSCTRSTARPTCAPPARGTRWPWHLDKAYQSQGKDAQHAFWGVGEDPELSMLHQIGIALGGQ